MKGGLYVFIEIKNYIYETYVPLNWNGIILDRFYYNRELLMKKRKENFRVKLILCKNQWMTQQ